MPMMNWNGTGSIRPQGCPTAHAFSSLRDVPFHARIAGRECRDTTGTGSPCYRRGPRCPLPYRRSSTPFAVQRSECLAELLRQGAAPTDNPKHLLERNPSDTSIAMAMSLSDMPEARSAMSLSWSTSTLALPNLTPRFLARSSPARVRSPILSRSCSATQPQIARSKDRTGPRCRARAPSRR